MYKRFRFVAVLWTLLILVACSLPGRDLPRIDVVSFDKVAHFIMFAGFGGLWAHAFPSLSGRRTAWVLVVGLAFAILTEIYQSFLPFERTPDPYDALFNALGLCTAVVICHLRHARSTSSHSPA